MRTISSTEAKATLNAVLADVERTGRSVTITNHGRPVAVVSPVAARRRRFGEFDSIEIPDDFDAPLTEDELADWNGE